MSPNSRSEALIRELEMTLLGAEGRSSPETLSELIADDFVEFGSSGLIWDKAQTVAGLLGETAGPAISRSAYDFRVRFLAEDVALITYRAEQRISGETGTIHTLRSSIWRREGERWQLVFHQGTQTQPGSG